MAQDIQDQKALIADLKAKRDAAGELVTPHNPRKRQDVESPALTFAFDKQPEVGQRAIVTVTGYNSRPTTRQGRVGNIGFRTWSRGYVSIRADWPAPPV